MDPMSIALIILFTFLAIDVFALSGLAFSDCKVFFGAGIGLVLIGLIFVFLIVLESYDSGHKSGQIDAANGKQTYHLTTQPDNTSKWELKKK